MNRRIALVTGANRGIGFATVTGLLDHGFVVILTARKEEDGQQALDQLGRPDDLYFHPLDVSDPESVERIAQSIQKNFGYLDVLINNAGINYKPEEQAVAPDFEEVLQTLDTNLIGAWRMCKAFVPMMKKRGYGRIVNVSSGLGAITGMTGGNPSYSISKVALNALTIKLASELAGSGVQVNSACPGWVRTDMGGSEAPRSPEEGAETLIWLAEQAEDGPSGLFFRDKQEISF